MLWILFPQCGEFPGWLRPAPSVTSDPPPLFVFPVGEQSRLVHDKLCLCAVINTLLTRTTTGRLIVRFKHWESVWRNKQRYWKHPSCLSLHLSVRLTFGLSSAQCVSGVRPHLYYINNYKANKKENKSTKLSIKSIVLILRILTYICADT